MTGVVTNQQNTIYAREAYGVWHPLNGPASALHLTASPRKWGA